MNKFILFLILIIFPAMPLYSQAAVIEGSVSVTDRVPKNFFGDWRVASTCIKTTNKDLFDTHSLDIWTLTRQGDIIVLANPLSGARAQITADEVKGNTVKFVKRSSFPGEESTETPILTLNGDSFTGVDKITIKTFEKGKLIREDYVEFIVKGTKISGRSTSDIFGI